MTHARISHASVVLMTNAVALLLFAIMATAWDALMILTATAIQIIVTLIILPPLTREFVSAEILQLALVQHQGAKELERLRPVWHAQSMIIALAIMNSATQLRIHARRASLMTTALILAKFSHYRHVSLALHQINASVVLMSAEILHPFARI